MHRLEKVRLVAPMSLREEYFLHRVDGTEFECSKTVPDGDAALGVTDDDG